MTEEELGFIQQIIAEPDNDSHRLIYADWLEEQNDARSEFIRSEIEMRSLPEESERREQMKAQLNEMRRSWSPKWLAAMDRAQVLNCGQSGEVKFQFQCTLNWEDLDPTGDHAIRHCDQCNHSVYHCSSEEEARYHARQGNCVSIDSHVTYDRFSLELLTGHTQVMGLLRPTAYAEQDRFLPGQRVRITSGTFEGEPGEIVQQLAFENASTVAITLFGVRTLIEVPVSSLQIPE